MGFIAQEVEKQFPVLVNTDKEGYKTVNYNGIAAPIVEAIKELKTLFDDLVKQVAQLFDITAAHEKRIAALEETNSILNEQNRTLRARVDDIESTLTKEAP